MQNPRMDVCTSHSGRNLSLNESVRLVSDYSLCSGSVQIWNQSWTWLCEGALDLLGAEVLCRELDCGLLLSSRGRSLQDCRRSTGKGRGFTLSLVCSETLKLVGGASRCAGAVELKHEGEWRRMTSHPYDSWPLEATDVVCRLLHCGSAVSGRVRDNFPKSPVWTIYSACVTMKSVVRDCVSSYYRSSSSGVDVVCSGETQKHQRKGQMRSWRRSQRRGYRGCSELELGLIRSM
ncbi:hypothetical protein WMY93_001697 [Mugilogobius chulae]|uniref:SRCR domain-containing protein n=1 Tax=Mugilogobius chulae TaxID=88201 RepID=A0AAW0PXG7_9GOBI